MWKYVENVEWNLFVWRFEFEKIEFEILSNIFEFGRTRVGQERRVGGMLFYVWKLIENVEYSFFTGYSISEKIKFENLFFFYGIRFQILFSWKRGLLKGKSYSIYSTCFRFKPLTVSLVFSQQLTKFKYEGSTRKKGNVNFSEFWILHFSYCVMLPCVLIITGYVLLIWMKISCSFMVITRNCGAQCTFHFSQSNLTHYILLRIIKKS